MANKEFYDSIKTFVNDCIPPHNTGVREYLLGEMDSLRDDFEDFKDEVNQILQDVLYAHINNFNNPHQTKAKHLFTIASYPPTNNLGKIGDIWIEYIPTPIPKGSLP